MDKQTMPIKELENISACGLKKRTQLIIVSLFGFLLDLFIINFLYSHGFSLSFSHIISFITASSSSYLINLISPSKKRIFQLKSEQFAKFIIIVVLILFLREGILATLIQLWSLPIQSAFFICTSISWILNYIGDNFENFSRHVNDTCLDKKWDYFFIFAIIYSVLLRFFYLGLPELFYEEAYYWNYAKHLNIGYLDHPPLVAWIIWLFTKLIGNNEFAVRFGAFTLWFVMAYFSYRLARDIDKNNRAGQVIVLVATLPAFFATGWAMTPDAPLMACWAATIYFLYQALIHEQRKAWVGIGIAMGLGMLSKYTIALLGPAGLLFILADRPSRKWIFQPDPYLAIFIAIIIFSPVIIWNMGHEWASLLYQSRDRMADHFEFSLPDFLISIILILTPTGFFSLIAILLYRKTAIFRSNVAGEDTISNTTNRGYFLLLMLTFFPVAVFLATSLFRETKFHWTAPCWLGVVPYMALIATRNSQTSANKFLEWTRRAWPATILICLIFYGAALHYLSLGFPGIPYPSNLYLLGWQGFGREIETLVEQIERETNDKVLVVGMDRNRIASGLAFYRTKANESSNNLPSSEPAFQTSSWHLFGGKSLMYEYWFPIEKQTNKTMLLVGRNIANLTSDNVLSRVRQAGDIKDIKLWKNGRPAGLYYYRLVKGYQSEWPEGNAPAVTPSD